MAREKMNIVIKRLRDLENAASGSTAGLIDKLKEVINEGHRTV